MAILTWIATVTAVAVGFAADYEPGTPFTYLFDTQSSSATALEPAALETKRGWQVLAEDDLKHAFRGDAVLLNDKLVVVLRRRAAGAEVYARGPAGFQRRATVGPQLGTARPSGMQAFRTVENGPSAVLVEAVFRAADGAAGSLKYRLTTGQGLVELRAGENVRQAWIDAAAAWAVVPDFFGDDAVLGPALTTGATVGVPAENFFLTLADQGRAMLMCVWPSAQQRAELLFSAAAPRAITGFRIDLPPKADQAMWLALLEGQGLWQERTVERDARVVFGGEMTFPAKWRGDVVGRGVLTTSWNLFGADDEERAPEKTACPCPRGGEALRADEEVGRLHAKRLLLYPIDRSRATPLTMFCPIDVLRNTLGVGPCQYILQTEGLASETNPTPDNVMKWVEQQFNKKKERRAADEIRALLEQMAEHVGHAQQRVARYAASGAELRALLPAASPMRDSVDYLERAVGAAAREDARTKATQLSTQVLNLIGREGAAVECRRLGVEIRGVGAAQDAAMARARMALRWLREQARQAGDAKIGARVTDMLQGH